MSAVQQNLSHSHNSPQDVHVNIESERLPVSDRSIGRGGPPITERNEVSGSQYDPGDGIQRSSLVRTLSWLHNQPVLHADIDSCIVSGRPEYTF